MEPVLLGALAALAGAAGWSVASQIYGRVGGRFSAIFLNMFKNVFSLVLLVPMALLLSESTEGIHLNQFLLVFASGVLGIGIGDSAYIAAVARLGARRVLVTGTITPVVTSLFAFLFLSEKLRWQQGLSLLIILAGIAAVLSEKRKETDNSPFNKSGFLYLALSVITYSMGTVVSRGVFIASPISPLWTSIVRLSAGAVITFLSLASLRLFAKRGDTTKATRVDKSAPRDIGWLVVAALAGTVMGLWMQQAALKLAPAAIAQTLLCTSPIFALPVARLAGEKLSVRSIIGAFIATLGTASLVLL